MDLDGLLLRQCQHEDTRIWTASPRRWLEHVSITLHNDLQVKWLFVRGHRVWRRVLLRQQHWSKCGDDRGKLVQHGMQWQYGRMVRWLERDEPLSCSSSRGHQTTSTIFQHHQLHSDFYVWIH